MLDFNATTGSSLACKKDLRSKVDDHCRNWPLRIPENAPQNMLTVFNPGGISEYLLVCNTHTDNKFSGAGSNERFQVTLWENVGD